MIDRWEEAPSRRDENRPSAETTVTGHYPVITIGREYGSGGHEIGEMVAQQLGVPFYDNAMMEMVATESGFSISTVREYDQRLPHSLLFEMITQDFSVPIERSLSKKDALFVAQSRVIRRLAAQGSCVIVGRCSDYVLRDNPNAIHIFLRASAAHKTKRAIETYNIDPAKVADHVARTNAMRRDHYAYYTGKTWGDARNYTATFDISVLPTQAIVNAIASLAEPSANPSR